jgi:Kdo2-lipid IVA lauroyltransferase/acyltransferase
MPHEAGAGAGTTAPGESMATARAASLFDNLQYFGARAILSLFGALPRGASIAIASTLARIVLGRLRPLRHTAERNVMLAFPGLSTAERDTIVRRSFESSGRQLAEFSRFPRADAGEMWRLIEGAPGSAEALEAARARGKGILFVTAHLGAWELLVFAYSARFEPIHYMQRPMENSRIDELVRVIRSRFGNQALDKNKVGLSALRLLRSGKTLGVLADLNSLPQEGVFTPFFGHLACTTAGVAALALPTDATVLPVFAPWDEKRQRYRLHCGPALELVRTGDYARDLELNTARVAAMLETVIRRYPDQWLWIHDRWRARPRPGDRLCAEVTGPPWNI